MARVSDERALWLSRHILPHEPALRVWLSRRRVFDLDIDDIVQDTYARLAAAESVVDVRNPKAYLFQTAHSVIFSHLRRTRVVSIRAVEDVELWKVESDDVSPERVASDRDELHKLALVIASLPKQIAAVFTLRKVEGLSQRETAAKLGISESTVEKHMGKGAKLLMDALGRSGYPAREASTQLDEAGAQTDDKARDQR
jgi:RNA polymerase sigma factor (sigma-70 family)